MSPTPVPPRKVVRTVQTVEPADPEAVEDANSELAQSLVDSGAAPVMPDIEAIIAQLQAQIAAQQKHIEALMTQAGQPIDPLASAVQNLVHHVKARADANPGFDFSELMETLKNLPKEVTAKEAELVKELVAKVVEAGKHLEVGYLTELARNLHIETLKAA